MKILKKLKYFSLSSIYFLTPLVALAQEGDYTFVNSVALWIAVVVGLIATGLVFRNAKKIGGGSLQKVYNYFALGMLLVVLGFFAVVIPPWASGFVIMRTHDLLFVAGFALMAYGASKMLSDAGL